MATRPPGIAQAACTLASVITAFLLLVTAGLAVEALHAGNESATENSGLAGAAAVQEPAATSASAARKANLVLGLRAPQSAPQVTELRFEVRAPDLRDPVRGRVQRSEEGLSGGVFIPPGTAREVLITGLDSKGTIIYEGKTRADIAVEKPASFGLTLEPREQGEPLAVTVSKHAIRIDRLMDKNGQVRLRARVSDAQGAPVHLTPDDYRWGLIWLHPYEFTPWIKKPTLEVDFPPASSSTEVNRLIVCPSNTTVTFCAVDNCASIDPCADPVVAISAGATHTCALTKNGIVLCWGNNSDGQLGSPQRAGCDGVWSQEPFCTRAPTRVACAPGNPCAFKQISAGRVHTCAIDTTDTVWCWGDNTFKQLGVATPDPISIVPVRSVGNALAVAAGDDFTCALRRAGVNNAQREVWCWGANDKGQTGQPLTAPSGEQFPGPRIVLGPVDQISTPTRYMSAPPNKLIVAGARHACAVTTDGWMSCWGDNNQGQVANTGTITVAPITGNPFPGSETCGTCTVTRVQVAGFLLSGAGRSPLDLAAAGGDTTCASFTGAWTDCWGENRVMLPSAHVVKSIDAGHRHTCVVSNQGTSCWGTGTSGQLGNGGLADQPTPQTVLTTLIFAQVTAGGFHTCGLTTDGKVACWGRNAEGQLGTGSTSLRVVTPVNSLM
jgi:alpha-tubulin suppressor-like RCC1 family protein